MHRIVLAALVLSVVTPAGHSLAAQSGQAPEARDSTQLAASVGRAGNAPIVVQVASPKLPFEVRDLLMLNCAMTGLSEGLTSAFPYLCARHMTGTLAHLDADSVVFVRNGRTIRLAAREVRKLEQLTGRSTLRTVGFGAMGALTGVVVAGMIGIAGGYGTDGDAAFVGTAVGLGTLGAAVGSYRGGLVWREVPRSFAVPPATQR
jgi:hypothetical protein